MARPGLQTVFQLPREIRSALEPVFDVVMKVTGVTTTPLKPLTKYGGVLLDPATATTVDIATRVNELQSVINTIIGKQTQVISRIQED